MRPTPRRAAPRRTAPHLAAPRPATAPGVRRSRGARDDRADARDGTDQALVAEFGEHLGRGRHGDPHCRVISRVDGTRSPGASSPVSMRCLSSPTIRV
ncbi:hypothetical protein GCM10025734_77140 [Kitasatospora paranensis]